jgi:hypothetical protein
MRKSEEELRRQFSFNYDNFSEILYADKPKEHRDEEWFDRMIKLADNDCITANILAVDMYVYRKYGEHYFFETLRGNIGVKDGRAFFGQFFVDYKGLRYNIFFTGLPYERNSLHISHNGEFVTGWRNESGMHSPSHKIKLLDTDRVKGILTCKDWDDFGVGVQLFKERITEVFEENPRNFFNIL